ncbi:MAG: sodium:calcium antiporter [Alistipes sp.]|nr:sodium:calcium antiporter [Alistipes sp.]
MSWLLLVLGLTMLTVGATWLTNGSVAVAKRLQISEYVIGMMIVAVGTSLPELTVSAASAIAGNADVALGNVVGSNIFNVFAILGICAVLSPIPFSRNNIRYDAPIALLVSVIFTALIFNGTLSRLEGALLLALYVGIMAFSFIKNREKSDDAATNSNFAWWRSLGMIALGICGLIYGANIALESSIEIARSLGVSEAVIAITILAGGTSLPELAASLIAALKGHSALALGNVLGSCIANILLILGLCSTVVPLSMTDLTMTDLLVMVLSAAAVLLSAILVGRKRISRLEGAVYIIAYVAYIVYLVRH